MDLLREVQDYIQTHTLFEPGSRIVVGVSGGPDSVVLLHVLRQLAPSLDIHLHVAHLHHGIRGTDADADAAFVEALARQWGLPCTLEHADVPKIAAHKKIALEQAARQTRYAFLCRTAYDIGAQRIAVGHNADDQAETVLMHVLRGAGPAGLRGMLPATRIQDYRLLPQTPKPGPELFLIRPLLAIPRASIAQYCEAQALETRFDRSNLDTTLFRNKLRHEVLPYLADINPRIKQRLRHLAEVVRADYELIQEFVRVAWDTLQVHAYSDAFVFDLQGWRAQPLAIRRTIIRRAAYKLRHTLRDVDFGHIEHAVRVAQEGQTGAEATLPRNLRLTVGYTTLTIGDQEALHLPPEQPWLNPGTRIQVPVPGEVELLGGWHLHTQWASHWNLDVITENTNPFVAWLDAEALGDQPLLRTRQTGDRLHPQGLGGSEVRLSDFLINVKLPQPWRDYLPLLEADGRILWVAGVRLSEEALVRPETQRVVYLRFQGPQLGAMQTD